MGAHSFVMSGAGNREALESACHGAGRVLSRSDSRRVDPETYANTVERLRVVTPIDPHAYEIRSRRNILAQYRDRLKEEAPNAYLWPLLTVKG
jgi:tRNA-splicing ligase RtcB (3'-phosphate/5'-hydroxy nucleic acid ligase)